MTVCSISEVWASRSGHRRMSERRNNHMVKTYSLTKFDGGAIGVREGGDKNERMAAGKFGHPSTEKLWPPSKTTQRSSNSQSYIIPVYRLTFLLVYGYCLLIILPTYMFLNTLIIVVFYT